jgi:hypothetical protein
VTPAAGLLAATPDANQVSPGLLGFAVVFGLALATVLLIRSMVYHLRKVRYSPDPAAPRPAAGSPPTDEAGAQDGSPDDRPGDQTGS